MCIRDSPKYAPKVKNTQASAILVTQPVTDMPIASVVSANPVSYTHLRAHEPVLDLVCRLLLEKKTY